MDLSKLNTLNVGQLQPPSSAGSPNMSFSSDLASSPQLYLNNFLQQSMSVSQQHLQPQSPFHDQLPSSPTSSSLLTSPTNTKVPSTSTTFVHKLYDMVVDPQYQHLISWNYSGISFVVCSISEFSKEVLPKHFKHSNFSSFVRQLNMYGFHKVNKSPRGQRTASDNQTWEFSHPKFMRSRPDLLDEIKRKSIETESLRRDTGDILTNFNHLRVGQLDVEKKVNQLESRVMEMARELADTKQQLATTRETLQTVVSHLQQSGHQDLICQLTNASTHVDNDRPQILVTNHDTGVGNLLNNLNLTGYSLGHNLSRVSTPTGEHSPLSSSFSDNPLLHLQPNSHNLTTAINLCGSPGQTRPVSPNAFVMYQQALNTPLPPSPIPPHSPGAVNMTPEDDIEIFTVPPFSANVSGPPSTHGSDSGDNGIAQNYHLNLTPTHSSPMG
ncbi:hypothetical protein IWQ62_000317 [Dispira parvispora]|uniref:HSF-type DNA-binding domain-containing protein n=1 Tax=Dispira parvispora TaxID=1520584 RepID=A0A9W8AUQ9_9FUNG|nr:hypothetical protein IWQ62_000317 [Dispira parvispora]